MFPFVPRKVAQKSKAQNSTQTAVAQSSSTKPPRPKNSAAQSLSNDPKGKGKQSDTSTSEQDLATLLWLSLSDHSLWLNVDLRRALASADEGWLPLSVLLGLHHATYFAHLKAGTPDSAYVKAVRTHADDLLEVRMRVSAPSKAAWYGAEPSSSKEEASGYEVRRKDWREALPRARNSTRQEWELRTVYMECIPPSHRAIPGIYDLTASLLDLRSSGPGHTLTTHIQSIALPAHHLDRPGDIPKPKGFALVTFSSEDCATRLTTSWPWSPRRASVTNSGTDPAHEAAKFGFRALPKARWDALKDEYLAHRQRLLDEIARAESADALNAEAIPAETPPAHHGRTAKRPPVDEDTRPPRAHAHAHAHALDKQTATALAPSATAPFPRGCLVYVRHVHPETNKTTLKALFAAHGRARALDYVDYSKGMDTCHLRVSTPAHAQTLVSAFAAHRVTQRQGLDGTGATAQGPGDGAAKPIEMELVEGTREELYWSKVPEKVRREAVRKAVALAEEGDGGGEDAGRDLAVEGPSEAGEQEGKRKRKRRRKA
ncbi:hypothetical protein C8Q79DRAFT_945655 [Trametes meyenii]|nr:hypothetical protein C8Q79DRAFT_945655 [Trametes meyenii]